MLSHCGEKMLLEIGDSYTDGVHMVSAELYRKRPGITYVSYLYQSNVRCRNLRI